MSGEREPLEILFSRTEFNQTGKKNLAKHQETNFHKVIP